MQNSKTVQGGEKITIIGDDAGKIQDNNREMRERLNVYKGRLKQIKDEADDCAGAARDVQGLGIGPEEQMSIEDRVKELVQKESGE